MRAVLSGILSSGLLVACGGGGGGSGSAGFTPPPAALLAITATNQDAVGRATAIAATAFLDAGGGVATDQSTIIANSSLLSAAPAKAGRGSHSISALALRAARTLSDPSGGRRKPLAADASAASARPLAIAPQTTPCSVSGSVTLSFLDPDNNNIPSLGDTMTLAFNQCRDTLAESINGSIVIVLSRFDVVADLVSFTGTLLMQQLTVTDGARVALVNGSLSMTYTERSAAETQLTLAVGTAGLSANVSGAGLADSVTFEPGFALNEIGTFSTAPGGVSFSSASLSGGFNSTSANGRVLLETPTPLLLRAADTYPYAGTLRAVGSNSALRLQALDAVSVRLELDATLDGIYEASKVLAWATLLPG